MNQRSGRPSGRRNEFEDLILDGLQSDAELNDLNPDKVNNEKNLSPRQAVMANDDQFNSFFIC